MSAVDTLVNQHFLEWESRLKHIDEDIAKAHAAQAQAPQKPGIQARLSDIRKSRDELALGVATARGLPANGHPDVVKHVDGLTASFAAVGLELERVFASIVGSDAHV